jgi:rRNA maturation RNase YbeY
LALAEAELSLVLTDDQGIAELNRRYLQRAGPTNVISFPQLDEPRSEKQGTGLNPDLLGDVVISVETAAREAQTAGQELEWALDRLLIHGILHLVGFDHEAEGSDAAAMEAEEARLMASLGWR